MRFRIFVPVLMVLILLTACDQKDRTPLSGARESIILVGQKIALDSTLQSRAISPIPAQVNAAWSQLSGNAAHSMLPAKMSADPKLLWSKDIGQGSIEGQRLLANPILDGAYVYAMDASGAVSCFKADGGSVVWTVQTTPEHAADSALGGGICIEDHVIYVSTSFGDVIALNAKDGLEMWRQSVKIPVRVAPTVHNGKVIVVSIANETTALSAQNGEILWKHAGIVEPAALLGGGSPAAHGELIVVAYSSGEVFGLHESNGQVLWSDVVSPALSVETVSVIPHIRARPIIHDGRVFVISHGGRMSAIDAKTGLREWEKDVAGVRTPAVMADWLFVLTSQGEILCLDTKTGGVRWVNAVPQLTTEEKNPIFWAGPILVNDQLVLSGSNHEVRFLSMQDGNMSKTLTLEGPSFISPVIAGETLYILLDTGVLTAWK